MNSAKTVGAATQLDAFEMALRETRKAWVQARLADRVKGHRLQHALAVLRDGTPEELGALLENLIGGTALSAQPHVDGLQVDKAHQLTVLMAEILAHSALKSVDLRERARAPEGCVERLTGQCRRWISEGAGADPNLAGVNTLVGNDPTVRLALVAPLAPALAMLQIVTESQAAAELVPAEEGSSEA